MFNEMAAAGLPAPEYRDNAFMLNAIIRNGAIIIPVTEQAVLSAIRKNPRITKAELQKVTSLGKSTIDRSIKALKEKCLIYPCAVSISLQPVFKAVSTAFFASLYSGIW